MNHFLSKSSFSLYYSVSQCQTNIHALSMTKTPTHMLAPKSLIDIKYLIMTYFFKLYMTSNLWKLHDVSYISMHFLFKHLAPNFLSYLLYSQPGRSYIDRKGKLSVCIQHLQSCYLWQALCDFYRFVSDVKEWKNGGKFLKLYNKSLALQILRSVKGV